MGLGHSFVEILRLLHGSYGFGALHMVMSVSSTYTVHMKTDLERKTKPSLSPILYRLKICEAHRFEKWPDRVGIRW